MCRLYVFRSTERTKVECTLVHAQNALISQSRQDLAGYSHTHGWGLATYDAVNPQIERQAWAAYHGEHFARAAARIYSTTVIAHVRRATVGGASLENTHPFVHGRWAFAHNGTVPEFDKIKVRLLAGMTPAHRNAIQGQTDSEHLFRYAMSLIDTDGSLNAVTAVQHVVEEVSSWTTELNPKAALGLNVILTDGETIAGSRLGRSLYYVTRVGVYDCEICGFPHIHHDPDRSHRAVVVASEPITHEDWTEIPERSTWQMGKDAVIEIVS